MFDYKIYIFGINAVLLQQNQNKICIALHKTLKQKSNDFHSLNSEGYITGIFFK